MLDKKINIWQIVMLKNYYPFETIKNLPMLQWDVYQHVIALDRYFLRHGNDGVFNHHFKLLMEPLALAGLLTQSVVIKPEDKFKHLIRLKFFARTAMNTCPRLTFLIESLVSSILRMLHHD